MIIHKPIIKSLLDTDFYKLTMAQAVLHHHPEAMVRYKFKCRNAKIGDIHDIEEFRDEIQRQVNYLCMLRFTQEELDYLSNISFFKPDFIEFLRLFQLNPDFIDIRVQDNDLEIEIFGPHVHTIFFEVPVLAVISEIHHSFLNETKNGNILSDGAKNLKSDLLKYVDGTNIKFADFGTRRRFSKSYQETAILNAMKLIPKNFVGTSNVMFAMKYNLTPIGTMAHEWLQVFQAFNFSLVNFQKESLEAWAHEYRGDLGIALSDVVGFDVFIRDFDKYFAKLFDGCRHDSGDPVEWCDKLIKHYEKLGIDPKTKTAVFSDGLTFTKIRNLYFIYKDIIKTSFGIGTNFTNNIGSKPLQIVIKMVECNKSPVAKISDSKGKGMCEDEGFLKKLKNTFNIKD